MSNWAERNLLFWKTKNMRDRRFERGRKFVIAKNSEEIERGKKLVNKKNNYAHNLCVN